MLPILAAWRCALGTCWADLTPLQIADTKSGSRKDFNLLHFVVDTIDSLVRMPSRFLTWSVECVYLVIPPAQAYMAPARKLDDELSGVQKAATVNLKELLKDIRAMEAGLKLMERELAWHAKLPVSIRHYGWPWC